MINRLLRLFTFLTVGVEFVLKKMGINYQTILKILKPVNQLRHFFIEKKIRKDTDDIIKNFDKVDSNVKAVLKSDELPDNPIWVMWWQNDKPFIIDKNIKKMRDLFGNQLILISKENYDKYLDIDKQLKKKIDSDELNLTTFSDYVRTGLLYLYGGLWLDSTILLTDDFSLKTFQNGKSFYTIIGENIYCNSNKFASEGLWTGYMMGGIQGEKYFKLANEIMRFYLLKNTKLPDYFTIDYALRIGYKDNIDGFRDKIAKLKKINENVLRLSPILNKEFDQNTWDSIKKNTYAFKLTYKQEFFDEVNNKPTFFGKLYFDL